MSEQNLETAQQGYEAWNRGDADWLLKKFWEGWRDAWSSIEIRVQRMEDMADPAFWPCSLSRGWGEKAASRYQ